MREKRRVEESTGKEAKPRRGQEQAPAERGGQLRRYGRGLLIAAWMVLVIVVYFRLQTERVMQMVGAGP